MIDSSEIAHWEEARLARAYRELADAHIDIAGGVASCTQGKSSWLNALIGAGMDAPVEAKEIDRALAFFAEYEVAPTIEVCPHASPNLLPILAERGFALSEFETVLVTELTEATVAHDASFRFEKVRLNDADAVEAFVRVHVACFAEGAPERADALRDGAERMLRHPATHALVARIDGELAGAGAFESDGVGATLFAAATLPRFRRRGLQQAIIEERKALAAAEGCRFATVGSTPGGPTERNALRTRFVPAYTRALMRRPNQKTAPSNSGSTQPSVASGPNA